MDNNSTKLTEEKVISILTEYENEEKIFSQKIQGIYFYKLIRVKLYSRISSILFGTEDIQAHYSVNNFLIIYNFIKSFIFNLLKKEKKIDVLLFDGGKTFFYENQQQSVYMFDIISQLKKDNIPFAISYPWSTPSKERFYEKVSTLNFFLQYIGLMIKYKINKKFCRKILSFEEIELIEKNNQRLCNLLGIDKEISLLNCIDIKREIDKFLIQYNYYYTYLKKQNLKKIYMICSYGKEGIIAAAQDLNIEVVELQHGSITRFHLGYHYSIKEDIPYFPNYFYTFGKYWEEIINFPVNTRLKTYGFPYLRIQLKKYKNLNKVDNQILFISQGNVGIELLKKALNFALNNQDKSVIYRLHPGELGDLSKQYYIIVKEYNLNNFIIDECKMELYKLMKESEYIFAVSSTVIYEGLSLEADIGIVKLPSSEAVSDLIKCGYVDFYEEEKIDKIHISNLKNTNYDKFFNIEMEEDLC